MLKWGAVAGHADSSSNTAVLLWEKYGEYEYEEVRGLGPW